MAEIIIKTIKLDKLTKALRGEGIQQSSDNSYEDIIAWEKQPKGAKNSLKVLGFIRWKISVFLLHKI